MASAVEKLKAAKQKKDAAIEAERKRAAQEYAQSAEAEEVSATRAASEEAAAGIRAVQAAAGSIQAEERAEAAAGSLEVARILLQLVVALERTGDRLPVPEVEGGIPPRDSLRRLVTYAMRSLHDDWRLRAETGARAPEFAAAYEEFLAQHKAIRERNAEQNAKRMLIRRALRACGCDETLPVTAEAGARRLELILQNSDPFAKLELLKESGSAKKEK
jgi:hypothetical protein